MKKVRYMVPLLLLATALLWLQGCYKDEGNYDYKEINEIVDITFEQEPDTVINGVPRFTSMDGQLTLTPKFTSTLPGNEANYTYRWDIIRTSEPYQVTVSRERNLENTRLGVLANITPYRIYFYAEDPATGVSFQKILEVTVSTQISAGFLVMNDIDGVMRLDMLSYYSESYHYMNDVLAVQGSTMPTLTQPRKIVNMNRPNLNGGARGLFLIGEENTYRINYDTFAWMESGVPGLFIHSSYLPQKWVTKDIAFAPNYQTSIILYGEDDGQPKVFNYLFFMSMAPWSLPTTRADSLFTISPHMACSNNTMAAYGWWVLFDEDAKSFYRISTSNLVGTGYYKCDLLPAGSLTSFENMNMDLVSLNWAGANFYAVLKDIASGKYAFLRFSSMFLTQDKWIENKMPDLDNARFFSVSALQPNNIYYVKGSKVYAWNIEDFTEYEVLDKGSKEITFFGVGLDNGYDFYVASYDGTEGEVETYGLGSLVNSPLELKLGAADFGDTNFGKIVNIVRK